MRNTLTTLSTQHMAEIGKKGGLATKRKKGRKFFSKISKARKKFGGGRPLGSTKPETI